MRSNVPAENRTASQERDNKKILLRREGDLPILPPPPVNGHEHCETLQGMIREFITIHYQLASGKVTSTPWTSLAAHQSILWDSQMWPAGVMVRDPSKIVVRDCQKIVELWRARQSEGGAKHAFRFKVYPVSDGVQPAIYNTSPNTLHTPAEMGTPTVGPPTVEQSDSTHLPSGRHSTPSARHFPITTLPERHRPVEVTPLGSLIDLPVPLQSISNPAIQSLPLTVPAAVNPPTVQPSISNDVPSVMPSTPAAPANSPTGQGPISPGVMEPPNRVTLMDSSTDIMQLPSIPTPAITPQPVTALRKNPVPYSNPPMLTAHVMGRIPGGDKEVESDPSLNRRIIGYEPESDPSTNEDADPRLGIQVRLRGALAARSLDRTSENNHEDLPPRLGRKKTKSLPSKRKATTRKEISSRNEDNSLTDNEEDMAEEHHLPQRKRKQTRPLSPHSMSDNTPVGAGRPRRQRRAELTSQDSHPEDTPSAALNGKKRGRPQIRTTHVTEKSLSRPHSKSDNDASVGPKNQKHSGKPPAVQRTAPTGTTPPPVGGKRRPRPIKKLATASIQNDNNGQTEQEQRDEEDAMFTVKRRSGRPPKPKYNVAPPAQLRLEKEREKRLR